MLNDSRPNFTVRGFTLIEIAIALAILGVLFALAMVPLSEQMRAQRARETQAALAEIREALIGYAVINGRLPCADTSGDGLEDSPCAGGAAGEGGLPWSTLGVAPADGWGNPWRYRADRAFTANRPPGAMAAFTLDTAFLDNLVVCGVPGAATAGVPACPSDAALVRLTVTGSSGEHPVAIVYSPGANTRPDGLNATFDAAYQGGEPGANFDDLALWVSRPVLIYRMIQAGRLP